MKHLAMRLVIGTLVAGGAFAPSAARAYSLNGSKWNLGTDSATFYDVATPPGTPGSATFSIMAAGLSFGGDDGHGGRTSADFGALVGGPTATEEIGLINQALNTWASVSGFVNLGLVADGGGVGGADGPSGSLGDLRFGAVDFGSDSNQLAHGFQPGTEALFGLGGSIGGDLHFNTNFPFVDDPNDESADRDFDFFTVALHEIGHALGLGHSTVAGSIMEATYAGSRRGLSADDVAGIQAIYGAPVPEPASLVALVVGAAALMRRRK